MSPSHMRSGFNAHHSPVGAFFSFTCGHPGTRGGMAAEAGRPADQDIYVGVKDGGIDSCEPLRCLPFYQGAGGADAAAAFLVEQAGAATAKKPGIVAYTPQEIERHYGWGSDWFITRDFDFAVLAPFMPVDDPETASAQTLREQLLPAVLAELTVDNRKGTKTRTAVFAIGFMAPGARLLESGLGQNRLGFGWRRQYGVAGEMIGEDASGKRTSPQAQPIFRWTAHEAMCEVNRVHHLGSTPGIAFEVPAGEIRTLRLAIGCYLEGTVTTRLEGRYYYTRLFGGLEEVLTYALDHFQARRALARKQDDDLAASKLSSDQQFLLAHATHSYYGSTQLLEVAGRPFWIVNEGEYCMLNTLDLSVDQVFWELKENPWVVRNLLESFVRYYSYRDQVKVPDGKGGFTLAPGGISFCHEMGCHNNFSPLGHSGYELPNLDALCFSHMTAEQVCNWTLMAGCYVARTGDTEWLSQNWPIIHDCLLSLQNRDHVDAAKRKGVMQLDSYRCGDSGAEITTYDSLDHSLAQSRNNLYIAVKGWAAYLSLALLFEKLGDSKHQQQAMASADLACQCVASKMGVEGYIPAVFEKQNAGHASRILPAIEGLVYPLYWRDLGQAVGASALDEGGRFAALLTALKQHAWTLLSDPQNRSRFCDGGIRLSSTSGNSWMSKIALVQTVARRLWGIDKGDQRQRAADAAHVKWQVEGASAYWAMSDQMVNGVAQGSKYYPRCVTTVLWMDE